MHSFGFFIVFLCLTIQVKSNLWNEFKRRHQKIYLNHQEELFRRQIFDERVSLIRRHNLEAERGLHTFTMKINQFADLKREEIIEKVSNKFPKNLNVNIFDQVNGKIFHPPSDVSIPSSIGLIHFSIQIYLQHSIVVRLDWSKKGAVNPIVYNQGQCASDWAMTATTVLEGQHFLKTGKLIRLSAQNLLDCSTKFANQGCNGGLVNAAFQYIKMNKGIDTEISYPYEGIDGQCRFNRSTIGATDIGFMNIEKGNETALQIALATIGPIGVAVDDLHDSFFFYASGVYDEPNCSTTDWSHTMTATGYDTWKNATTQQDYYIVKNSWGETWGWNGFVWMSRNKMNQCGIANWASYPLV